ncbi:MAG: glycosyltransferase family 4 protein [Myxococcales bacterium]|nr:glycosyltransferase family 4 protein [Myxococcales bacterium]
MRILFFSHYFPPEVNAPATRTYENCKRWVDMGHEVTVITGAPNCPAGVVFDGYQNKLYQREEVDGIDVVRIWTYIAANEGTVKRIANYVSYMLSSTIASLGLKRPDVIIATSPQFFCGWSGVLSSLWRGIPFILEIRDLWPDSIAAVGAMQQKTLLSALYQLEDWMYKAASHIVTVGAGYQQELIQKGVAPEKISVITNGVDPDQYLPRPPALERKQALGIKQPFVCSYVGTIGMACGLQVVLQSAEKLKQMGRDDIGFVLVGDGALRAGLQEEAEKKQLDNIVFTGLLEKSLMPEVLSFSDVTLVHLKKTDLFKTVLPSKIFEAASMERPILLGVEGFSAELIRDAQAGICIEPENAEELTAAVLKLADDPALCRQFGQNGRQYIQEHFDRKKLAETYLSLLQTLVKEGKVTP